MRRRTSRARGGRPGASPPRARTTVRAPRRPRAPRDGTPARTPPRRRPVPSSRASRRARRSPAGGRWCTPARRAFAHGRRPGARPVLRHTRCPASRTRRRPLPCTSRPTDETRARRPAPRPCLEGETLRKPRTLPADRGRTRAPDGARCPARRLPDRGSAARPAGRSGHGPRTRVPGERASPRGAGPRRPQAAASRRRPRGAPTRTVPRRAARCPRATSSRREYHVRWR